MHLQVKKNKVKVDLSINPDKSFFDSYHYSLTRDELLIPHS